MRDCYCDRCSLQFDKKYVFDLHLSLVHGENIEVKKETLISKENSQESQMSEKQFPKSEVEKQLQCDECNSVSKTNQNLKRHITSVHEGKKPFKCKICSASFAQKNHLTGHIVTVHEGEKHFKCDICNASFTSKQRLTSHIVSFHEGKKGSSKKNLSM